MFTGRICGLTPATINRRLKEDDTMTITELNNTISHTNPYTERDKLKGLLVQRRKLLLAQDKNVSDALNSNNLPAMLQKQSGL